MASAVDPGFPLHKSGLVSMAPAQCASENDHYAMPLIARSSSASIAAALAWRRRPTEA